MVHQQQTFDLVCLYYLTPATDSHANDVVNLHSTLFQMVKDSRSMLDDMLDDMLEHFRDYASISPYSETDESVTITVHVGINQRFYLWVMSYGDGIELLSPVKTRSEYLAEVRKMLGAYPEFNVK